MTRLLEKIKSAERTSLVLSDHIKIKHGFAFKGEYFGQTGSHVLVTPGNFYEEGGFRRRAEKDKWYSGPIQSEYILKKDDLVIAMTEQGEGLLGSSALIPNDELFLHNQRIGLVQIINPKMLDKHYLYYLFNSPQTRNWISASASGTKVRHTSPDRITSYEYDFPPLLIQQEIAEILYAYEVMIENNNRIAEKLEDVAQTLFGEWFLNYRFPGYEKVKFVESEAGKIPQGWEMSSLGKVSNNHDSRRIPLSSMERNKRKGDVPYYGANGILDYIDESIFSGEHVLFAEDGTVKTDKNTPVVYLVDGNFWVNNHAHILSGRTVSNYFLYLSLKKIHIDPYITGGVQPKITQQNLNSIPILVPDANIREKFEAVIQPINLKLKLLAKENSFLKETSKCLLKKLI